MVAMMLGVLLFPFPLGGQVVEKKQATHCLTGALVLLALLEVHLPEGLADCCKFEAHYLCDVLID